MEKNKLLTYLSVIFNVLENELGQMDETLADFDDGKKRGVEESRKEADNALQNALTSLVNLRRDIRALSYQEFVEKHDLTEG